jgi:hypothetical protein
MSKRTSSVSLVVAISNDAGVAGAELTERAAMEAPVEVTKVQIQKPLRRSEVRGGDDIILSQVFSPSI